MSTPRQIAQPLVIVLAVLGLAYLWKPLSTWLESALSIDSGGAFGVAFVAIVLGAALLVKFVREQF